MPVITLFFLTNTFIRSCYMKKALVLKVRITPLNSIVVQIP